MNQGYKTRLVALTILDQCLYEKQTLDYYFNKNKDFLALNSSEKNFCVYLIKTCFRHFDEINALIDCAIKKPLKKKYNYVLNILRLGITQLYFMKVPAYAAIDISVSLCKKSKFKALSNLVNASLRSLNKKKPEIKKTRKNWLFKKWTNDFGKVTADKIIQSISSEPPIDITIKQSASVDFSNINVIKLPNNSLRLLDKNISVPELPSYSDGLWWVQNFAASLVVNLFGNIENKKVIELCAAPGGKTLQLLDRKATVTAIEKSAKRIKTLEENLNRMNMKATIIHSDALDWHPSFKSDFILLDAPCSATGTLHRHPEIPWIKEEHDINELSKIQKKLLKKASHFVTKNGTIIYCVCSLQQQEGKNIIDHFLKNNNEFKRDPIHPNEIYNLTDYITEDGDLLTLPSINYEWGTSDGIFASRLKKVG